jgi:hypothetical protein
MKVGRVRLAWMVLVLVGCSQTPTSPPDTGSREAARSFYAALIEQDWPRARETLDAESRKRVDPATFARLGKQYRQRLGFEPEAVHVGACEEHGSEAIGHVLLTGRGAAGPAKYRDAISLRRNGATWEVVLPAHFGTR